MPPADVDVAELERLLAAMRTLHHSDEALIVALRNAAPQLLDELRALRADRAALAAEVARLREALEEITRCDEPCGCDDGCSQCVAYAALADAPPAAVEARDVAVAAARALLDATAPVAVEDPAARCIVCDSAYLAATGDDAHEADCAWLAAARALAACPR